MDFISGSESVEIGNSDRYYTEDGSSKISPSGIYLKINSISGGYVDIGDKKEYIDKAYCSIVDMRNGCIVSDWDGEACGFDWVNGKDVLAASSDSEPFDFLSARPSIRKIIDPLSYLSSYEVKNLLRCDVLTNENINYYQKLMRENSGSRKQVEIAIVQYLNSLPESYTINSKTTLYSLPNESAKTMGYLIAGDKVKFIQNSQDAQWKNIGYINAKGFPTIAWVRK